MLELLPGSNYNFQWPNLVGVDTQQAKAIILKENPLVTTKFVHENEAANDDFCCNRVQVLLNQNGKVKRVPFVG
ncbi:hypothetical protein RD792_000769 [Penstemon davidsonii]|uniref:Uncharacterized protein n=1 Tax=Penstemon davidsonii TaxID=160366 RepID=A0ABR0DLL1_9LAMI|nr:hypothetical protein RD792_000769 [Penstemon davidsonii]